MEEIGGQLEAALQSLLDRWRLQLPAGEPLKGRHDEVDLLLRVALVGWDALEPVERRRVGVWSTQYNVMRAFRPRRMARLSVPQVCMPRCADDFSFTDERLRPERLGMHELAGHEVHCYLNRYPFGEMHLLLLPDAERLLPQALDADLVLWACNAITAISERIPRAVLGWNALGAFASVNHAHFQLVLDQEDLPVLHPRWTVNGGSSEYPASVSRHDDPADAWQAIGALQERNVPFNALFAPGRTYVYPREPRELPCHAPWTTGFAFHELSGSMVVTRRAAFQSLTEDEITAELARHRVRPRRPSQPVQSTAASILNNGS